MQRKIGDHNVLCTLDSVTRRRRASMNTAEMTERIAETSPRLKARIAGVFYLLTILTGILPRVS